MILGFVHLIIIYLCGILLSSIFLQPNRGLAKLATAYLVGMVFSGWMAYILSLVFAHTDDPMKYGIRLSMALIILFLLYYRKKIHLVDITIKWKIDEKIFLVIGLLFSFWIMNKSFGYEPIGYFRIASNIYDDFNIHLGIIRSFSWGHNIPPQLPFFAGWPMRYHFMTDFTFAIFELLGWPISWAVNIPSALAFTALLVLIKYLGEHLFNRRLAGYLAVILFLFNSSLTWIKISSISQIWTLGKYLSADPFDKGIISIFWNLNTFVNQRHLIFALGVFLIVMITFRKMLSEPKMSTNKVIFAGVLLGLLPLWHSLVFLATAVIGIVYWLQSRLKKNLFILLATALLVSLPQLIYLISQGSGRPEMKLGFLMSDNLTLTSWLNYWILNLGLSIITVFAGWRISGSISRKYL